MTVNEVSHYVLIFLLSYLAGSIPFGLIIGLLFKGIDIRLHGSGNIGATNVLRTLGYPCGLTVMLLDAAKGTVPTMLAMHFGGAEAALLAGFAALLGHNRSIWLGFKGGKGVATSLGVLLGMAPTVAGMALAVWLIVLLSTRYVSMASIVAAVAVPPLMWATGRPLPVCIFGLISAVWVLIRHRDNIRRLLSGSENRFGAGKSLPEKNDVR